MPPTKKTPTPAAKTNDDLVLQLLAQVECETQEIAAAENPVYKTNRVFSFTDGDLSKGINLGTVSDVQALLKMAGFVISQRAAYATASDAILGAGVKAPLFQWCGYAGQDWIDDIGLRVRQITVREKRQRLDQLNKRLDALISPAKRAELELRAIQRELAKS